MTENKTIEPEITLKKRKWPFWVLLCVAASQILFLIWLINLKSVMPVVSPETTYVTEPLTEDGQRIDWQRFFKERFDTEEMVTDENGYRFLLQKIGKIPETRVNTKLWQVACQRLEIDPNTVPSVNCPGVRVYVAAYAANTGLNYSDLLEGRWREEDIPEVAKWVDANNEAIDLMAEAVRKRCFQLPWIWVDYPFVSDFIPQTNLQGYGYSIRVRGLYRIHIGDVEGAMDDAMSLIFLGRWVQLQGNLISVLYGHNIEYMAYDIPFADLSEPINCGPRIRKYMDELEKIPKRMDFDSIIEVDRFIGLANLEMEMNERHVFGYDWNVAMRYSNKKFDEYLRTRSVSSEVGDDPVMHYLSRNYRSKQISEAYAFPSPNVDSLLWERIHKNDIDSRKRKLALGMLLYYSENGHFPREAPEVNHSWRVRLLPYLGREERELAAEIRANEPWDSEHNSQFHQTSLPIFQLPAENLAVGETLFSIKLEKAAADEANPAKTAIMYRELANPVNWMNPIEPPKSTAETQIGSLGHER